MRLITNKSKNLLYRINVATNVTVQFGTSYAVATQKTADSASVNSFKIQGYNGTKYTELAGKAIAIGKLTITFTTPSTTGYKHIRFGLNGSSKDTLCRCYMDLKPSTTYTFTCNFTNITQGSISWKDMMLVEGSMAGEYEPYSYNLLDKWQYSATRTINGVTFTNNGDGTITYNGMTSVGADYSLQSGLKVVSGHKYLSYVGENTNDKISVLLYANEDPYNTFDNRFPNAEGGISTALKNSNEMYYHPKPLTNVSFFGFILKPQLYDLTLMYGAGNEPTTVDQFYTDHPELKVSPLGFIELKNLEINNKNIKRLRYKTWNNSLNELTAVGFRGSTILKGIKFINNGNGSWTIKGKKTETSSAEYGFLASNNELPVSNGDKILFTKMADDALNSKYSMYTAIKNSSHVWIANFGEEIINKDVIYIVNNASAAYVGMSFVVRTNDYIDITVVPQAYNLTKIYGAGKEPTTVEQFYKDHPLVKTSPLGFSDLGIIPSNSGIH